MRPGSGQRATETPLNPARAPGCRAAGPEPLPPRDRPAPASRPAAPAGTASGARERGDPGPSHGPTGVRVQGRPARLFLQYPSPAVAARVPAGWADVLRGLPPSRVSFGGAGPVLSRASPQSPRPHQTPVPNPRDCGVRPSRPEAALRQASVLLSWVGSWGR